MQRFTISLDDELATEFERYMQRAGYANRSEAIRDLLDARLSQQRELCQAQGLCMAVLSYVRGPQAHELSERLERLEQLQQLRSPLGIFTTQVHVDAQQCLVTLQLRGPVSEVRALANAIMAERGVRHGQLHVVMGRPSPVQTVDHAYLY
ncbi:nickel-responsive transcriptional regulator NikR [Comamonas sp. GB3 AK4-5]|uniref:nickel-responsive transcriptional regulator NikR n=1 Tax=Comamonas sp. GB3 AK4-5 TaxID=3231487 RepID=UPI00351F2867